MNKDYVVIKKEEIPNFITKCKKAIEQISTYNNAQTKIYCQTSIRKLNKRCRLKKWLDYKLNSIAKHYDESNIMEFFKDGHDSNYFGFHNYTYFWSGLCVESDCERYIKSCKDGEVGELLINVETMGYINDWASCIYNVKKE